MATRHQAGRLEIPLPRILIQSSHPPIRANIPFSNVRPDTVLRIDKAPAGIDLSVLKKSIADLPAGVVVATRPSRLAVGVTYSGSIAPPTIPGRYPVTVEVTDRNRQGTVTGDFHLIGMTYEQWYHKHFPSVTGESSNPDSDDTPYRIEYALGCDPNHADRCCDFAPQPTGMKMVFRLRREMETTTISAELSEDLRNWQPVESLLEFTNGERETRSIESPRPYRFIRLKANSN